MKKMENIYSQNGEDGVIREILSKLNHTDIDKWCVEFGAWDGIHLSNTYNLIKNKGYNAVLIEGDKEKFKDLNENIPQKEVVKICRFVRFEGKDTLDGILKTTPIPKGFDLLSIDIDGCDYHIFNSLEYYRPKVICIEFNPSIPNEVEYVQPKDFDIKRGASAKSIINLANKKGYDLVDMTLCNIFLVRNDLSEFVIGERIITLEDIRDDSDSKVFLFTGYDGTVLSNKKELSIAWHTGVPMRIDKMQYMPKYLRTYFANYNIIQKKSVFYLDGPKEYNAFYQVFQK